MVRHANIEPHNSYNTNEVSEILGTSEKTVERMTEEFEILVGEPKPVTLQGFIVRKNKKVSHDELVSFLERGAKAICE